MKSPSEVEDEKYDEFYQFIAKAFDKPLAKVRFRDSSSARARTRSRSITGGVDRERRRCSVTSGVLPRRVLS